MSVFNSLIDMVGLIGAGTCLKAGAKQASGLPGVGRGRWSRSGGVSSSWVPDNAPLGILMSNILNGIQIIPSEGGGFHGAKQYFVRPFGSVPPEVKCILD